MSIFIRLFGNSKSKIKSDNVTMRCQMKCENTIPGVILLIFFLLLPTHSVYAYLHPAELRIINTSQRFLTVKVMKPTSGGGASVYSTVAISSQSNKTVNIDETGDYYLKTKAVSSGTEPVYKKGNPFNVYVGSDGYSVLTVTFSIQESALPDPLSGNQISPSEFENNSN